MTITAKLAEALQKFLALDESFMADERFVREIANEGGADAVMAHAVLDARTAIAEYEAAKGAPVGDVDIATAREALDSMDDYARMDTGVDASGPRAVLEQFIEQAAALRQQGERVGDEVGGSMRRVPETPDIYRATFLADDGRRTHVFGTSKEFAEALHAARVDTARIRKALDLLNGVDVYNERSNRYLTEAIQELETTLAQQVDGEAVATCDAKAVTGYEDHPYTQTRPERASVPDGWQLVPKKITGRMAMALEGASYENSSREAIAFYVQVYQPDWDNVLAVAPQPGQQP